MSVDETIIKKIRETVAAQNETRGGFLRIADALGTISEKAGREVGFNEFWPSYTTVAEIRRQAMEEAKAEEKKAREELERKAEERLLEVEQRAAESMERAVKEAAEKAKQEAEQALQEKITQQQAQTEAATRRAEELTKRLEVESSKETVKFSLLFTQLQEIAGQMQDVIDGLRQAGNTEQADKLEGALRAALTQLIEVVE